MVSSSEGRRIRNRGSLEARPLAKRARVATPSAMQVGFTAAAVAAAATGGAGAGAITKRVRGERRRQARRGLVSPCARTETPSPGSTPPVVPRKLSSARVARLRSPPRSTRNSSRSLASSLAAAPPAAAPPAAAPPA
eukprot:scaffold30500_cov60-Phaeocystis_antarctica.AAC.1